MLSRVAIEPYLNKWMDLDEKDDKNALCNELIAKHFKNTPGFEQLLKNNQALAKKIKKLLYVPTYNYLNRCKELKQNNQLPFAYWLVQGKNEVYLCEKMQHAEQTLNKSITEADNELINLFFEQTSDGRKLLERFEEEAVERWGDIFEIPPSMLSYEERGDVKTRKTEFIQNYIALKKREFFSLSCMEKTLKDNAGHTRRESFDQALLWFGAQQQKITLQRDMSINLLKPSIKLIDDRIKNDYFTFKEKNEIIALILNMIETNMVEEPHSQEGKVQFDRDIVQLVRDILRAKSKIDRAVFLSAKLEYEILYIDERIQMLKEFHKKNEKFKDENESIFERIENEIVLLGLDREDTEKQLDKLMAEVGSNKKVINDYFLTYTAKWGHPLCKQEKEIEELFNIKDRDIYSNGLFSTWDKTWMKWHQFKNRKMKTAFEVSSGVATGLGVAALGTFFVPFGLPAWATIGGITALTSVYGAHQVANVAENIMKSYNIELKHTESPIFSAMTAIANELKSPTPAEEFRSAIFDIDQKINTEQIGLLFHEIANSKHLDLGSGNLNKIKEALMPGNEDYYCNMFHNFFSEVKKQILFNQSNQLPCKELIELYSQSITSWDVFAGNPPFQGLQEDLKTRVGFLEKALAGMAHYNIVLQKERRAQQAENIFEMTWGEKNELLYNKSRKRLIAMAEHTGHLKIHHKASKISKLENNTKAITSLSQQSIQAIMGSAEPILEQQVRLEAEVISEDNKDNAVGLNIVPHQSLEIIPLTEEEKEAQLLSLAIYEAEKQESAKKGRALADEIKEGGETIAGMACLLQLNPKTQELINESSIAKKLERRNDVYLTFDDGQSYIAEMLCTQNSIAKQKHLFGFLLESVFTESTEKGRAMLSNLNIEGDNLLQILCRNGDIITFNKLEEFFAENKKNLFDYVDIDCQSDEYKPLLQLAIESGSPEIAVAIANKIIDYYESNYTRMATTDNAKEFVLGQLVGFDRNLQKTFELEIDKTKNVGYYGAIQTPRENILSKVTNMAEEHAVTPLFEFTIEKYAGMLQIEGPEKRITAPMAESVKNFNIIFPDKTKFNSVMSALESFSTDKFKQVLEHETAPVNNISDTQQKLKFYEQCRKLESLRDELFLCLSDMDQIVQSAKIYKSMKKIEALCHEMNALYKDTPWFEECSVLNFNVLKYYSEDKNLLAKFYMEQLAELQNASKLHYILLTQGSRLSNEDREICKNLMQDRCQNNICINGYTPMSLCCMLKQTDLVLTGFKNFGSIDNSTKNRLQQEQSTSERMFPALHLAALYDDPIIIEYIMEKRRNSKFYSGLQRAAVDDQGRTILHCLFMSRFETKGVIFRAANSVIGSFDKDFKKLDSELLSVLDQDNNSLLHALAISENTELLNILLDQYCGSISSWPMEKLFPHWNKKNINGHTPMDIAVITGNVEMVQILCGALQVYKGDADLKNELIDSAKEYSKKLGSKQKQKKKEVITVAVNDFENLSLEEFQEIKKQTESLKKNEQEHRNVQPSRATMTFSYENACNVTPAPLSGRTKKKSKLQNKKNL